MPFSTVYTKFKTFANAGTLLPADLNSIQDDLGNQLATNNVMSGVNEGSNVRRGKSIISTSESRTNVAYGLLATPDQVQNVILPTDGLIVVSYQAIWQNSVSNAGRAAIFLGANQLKAALTTGAPTIMESAGVAEIADDGILHSDCFGLRSASGVGASTDVTTGQIIGSTSSSSSGPCYIFAAAGTYTVSVQFKSPSGSVTVKNRKLWVWTMGF